MFIKKITCVANLIISLFAVPMHVLAASKTPLIIVPLSGIGSQ